VAHIASSVFNRLGGAGGKLPTAVTSTDKGAPFNGESGKFARADVPILVATVDDDDAAAAAWGGSGVEGRSEIAALGPLVSKAVECLASNRKEAERSREYLRVREDGKHYGIRKLKALGR
jgi:hypothetical protein